MTDKYLTDKAQHIESFVRGVSLAGYMLGNMNMQYNTAASDDASEQIEKILEQIKKYYSKK